MFLLSRLTIDELITPSSSTPRRQDRAAGHFQCVPLREAPQLFVARVIFDFESSDSVLTKNQRRDRCMVS